MNIPSNRQSHNQPDASSFATSSHPATGDASDPVGAGGGDRPRGGYARRKSSGPSSPSVQPSRGPHQATTPEAAIHPTERREPAFHGGVRKCPTCKTYAYVTADSCPECGEELQLRPRSIRCRRCGRHANSELLICPHCARDLEPAPSRVWTVGAPALLALVFGIVLMGRLSGFGLATPGLNGVVLTGASESGNEVLVMTPVPGDASASDEAAVVDAGAAQTAGPGAGEASEQNPASGSGELALDDALDEAGDEDAAIALASEPTESGTESESDAVEAPADANAPEVEASTTEAPAGEATTQDELTGTVVLAGESAESESTATEAQGIGGPSRNREVGGETRAETAAGEESSEAVDEQDEELMVQAASAEPLPTSPPVSAGQENDAGDSQNAYRLAAPALRAPEDRSVLDCDVPEKLTWSPVPYMDVDHNYVLHLGFVSGREDDGSERVTWVVAQRRPANLTSWKLDDALCNLAPPEGGREWRWWVEVAQGTSDAIESISPPSETWRFRWE